MNLFFWKEPERTVLLPTAVEERSRIPEQEIIECISTANNIGWNGNSIMDEKLRSLFNKEGVKVFPFEEVEKFLSFKFGRPKWMMLRTWYWCPLRENDLKEYLIFKGYNCKNGQIVNNDWYHLHVPLRVLRIIDNIHDQIPEARFYVSKPVKEDGRDGNTFLMVTRSNPDSDLFVIERW